MDIKTLHDKYDYYVNDLAFIDSKDEYKTTYRNHRNDIYDKAFYSVLDYLFESTKYNDEFDVHFIRDDNQQILARMLASYMIEPDERVKKCFLSSLFRKLIECIYEGAREKVNFDVNVRRAKLIAMSQFGSNQ